MHLYDKKIVEIFHVVGNLAFTKYVKKLLELIYSGLFLIKADIQIGSDEGYRCTYNILLLLFGSRSKSSFKGTSGNMPRRVVVLLLMDFWKSLSAVSRN